MLTSEEYDVRMDELQKVKIVLPGDPVANGLLHITTLLGEIQSQKDRICHLLVEAVKNKAEAHISYKDAIFNYEQKLNELLATDKNVQAQKTVELRKATANNSITTEMLKQHHAFIDSERADAYYKCVNHIYNMVDSAKESLSRQISVIQLGVGIGEVSREDLGSFFPNKSEKTLTLEK